MRKKKSEIKPWGLSSLIGHNVALYTTIGTFAGLLMFYDESAGYAVLRQPGRDFYIKTSSVIAYMEEP